MAPLRDRSSRRIARARSPRVDVRSAVLLALLGAVGCSSPAPRPKEELVREGDVYLHPVTLEPYSGPVFTTFDGPAPGVEQRVNLREGRYDGPLERYFGNQQLSLREVYRAGRKDGPYEWYYESGRLYEKGTYRDGLLEGPYEAYYESGELSEKGTYRAGEVHGTREWYRADRLIELVTYVDGRIDGPYERNGTDGEPALSGILRDGQPCGTWLEGARSIVHPSCDTYETD